MGVAKKYRREIVINERNFLWYVKEDLDWLSIGCPFALSIISENKHFNISYGINQDEARRHLTSLGKEFSKLSPTKMGKPRIGYQRVRCPKWEKDSTITPEIVKQIVEWCFTYDANAIEIDWRGESEFLY
jgi:hypothetical protein